MKKQTTPDLIDELALHVFHQGNVELAARAKLRAKELRFWFQTVGLPEDDFIEVGIIPAADQEEVAMLVEKGMNEDRFRNMKNGHKGGAE